MILLVREQFTLPLSILKLKEEIRQRVGDDNGKFSIPLISPSFPFTDSGALYENLLLSRLILTTPNSSEQLFPDNFLNRNIFSRSRNVCEMRRTMRKRVAHAAAARGTMMLMTAHTECGRVETGSLVFFRQIIKKNDVHGLCITAKSK